MFEIRAAIVVLVVAAVPHVSMGQSNQPEVWFPTTRDVFIGADAPRTAFLRTKAEYDILLQRNPTLVRVPSDAPISEGAVFGFNFVFGGRNHAFAVDGDAERGYVIYSDLDADGSVRDNEALRLESRQGLHTLRFETSVTESIAGERLTYPVPFQITVAPVSTATGPRLGWSLSNFRHRYGTLHVDGDNIEFALLGRPGLFHQVGSQVWFDVNRDGRGIDEQDTGELFDVADARITLAGSTYAFTIDPLGRSLSLRRLDERQPNYSRIAVGEMAPTFSMMDIGGRTHALDQYRGRVVLLAFWAVWCGPCKDEAPLLNNLFRDHQVDGLSMLGITADTSTQIRAFQQTYGYAWPQVSEPYEGPNHRQFRVAAYPVLYLIGRDGRVRFVQLGSSEGSALSDAVKSALLK